MHTLSSLDVFLSAVTAVFVQDGVLDALFGAPTPFSLTLVVTVDAVGAPRVHGRGLGITGRLPSQRPKHLMDAARSLIDALLVLEGVSREAPDPEATPLEISPSAHSAHALVGPVARVRAHLGALGWTGSTWSAAFLNRCQQVVVYGPDAVHPRFSAAALTRHGQWNDDESVALSLWHSWSLMGVRRPSILAPLLQSLAPIVGEAIGLDGPAGLLVAHAYRDVDAGSFAQVHVHGLSPTPDHLWLQGMAGEAVAAVLVHAGFTWRQARPSGDDAGSTASDDAVWITSNAPHVFLSAHERLAWRQAAADAFAHLAWPGRDALLAGDAGALARHRAACRSLMDGPQGFADLRAESQVLHRGDVAA